VYPRSTAEVEGQERLPRVPKADHDAASSSPPISKLALCDALRSDRPTQPRINRLRCRRTDARKRREMRLPPGWSPRALPEPPFAPCPTTLQSPGRHHLSSLGAKRRRLPPCPQATRKRPRLIGPGPGPMVMAGGVDAERCDRQALSIRAARSPEVLAGGV